MKIEEAAEILYGERWATSRDAVPTGHTQITVYSETNGQRVATVFNSGAVPLIEAAPKLLEACELAAEKLEASGEYPGILEFMREAINEARGQS